MATTSTTTPATTNDDVEMAASCPPSVNKWLCVSPMTHHVIREPISPVRLRKRRSRSFGDYLESRDELRHHRPTLNLPSLLEAPLVPPKEDSLLLPTPTTATMDLILMDATSSAAHTTKDSELSNGHVDPELMTTTTSASSLSNATTFSGHTFFINVLYGIINATIVIPVVMSFGNIIYQDARFQPYTPVLIKLTMVSGVVHQLCFSAFSSLPFAVGSVQDAGLIFLSKMASDIVEYCQSNGYTEDKVILATVTVGLGVAAFFLGCGLVLIGKLQLAGYVQMLPTCVVAGYLAFIGFFCGKSGLGLMANTTTYNDNPGDSHVDIMVDWIRHLVWDRALFILPGVFGGIFIYLSVRTFRHVAVLPTCIAILLFFFYIGLTLAGSSIEQATHRGWIRKAEPAPIWYHTWDYLQLDLVVWSALPQLLLTEVSMLFVVALSSSLDVAAIELELSRPLDYNKELIMVGISNVVSGMTGGYTGSYIFSQSIFSLRSGIKSRVAGLCLAACQVLVIVTPIPLLSFVPNFFYGSLLGMICLDLMIEWLWDFRTKVTAAEYTIGLTTFGLIQWLGVEYGILTGVAIYITCRQLGVPVGDLKMVTDETMRDHAAVQ